MSTYSNFNPSHDSLLAVAALAAAPVVAAVVAAAAAAPVVTSEVAELSREMGFFGVGTPFTAAAGCAGLSTPAGIGFQLLFKLNIHEIMINSPAAIAFQPLFILNNHNVMANSLNTEHVCVKTFKAVKIVEIEIKSRIFL